MAEVFCRPQGCCHQPGSNMAEDTSIQYYQSYDVVTATLKLRPPETRGEITATFRKNYCAIYDGGDIYWECYLANYIVPSKCKLIVRKVRLEVRLFKVESILWGTFFVEPPLKKMDTDISRGEERGMVRKMERLDIEEDDARGHEVEKLGKEEERDHGSPLLADASPASSGMVILPAIPSPSTCDNLTTEHGDKLFILHHLRHDFYDLGNHVKVKVHVAEFVCTSCSVNFDEKVIEVTFQSSNEKSHAGSHLNTCRVWKVELYNSIVPSASTYKVFPHYIEIFLKKTSNVRWKKLSSSATHSVTGNNDPESATRDVAELLKEELLDSITNGRELNPPLIQLPKPISMTNGNVVGLSLDMPSAKKATPPCGNDTSTVSTRNGTTPLSETTMSLSKTTTPLSKSTTPLSKSTTPFPPKTTPITNITSVDAFMKCSNPSVCLTNSDSRMNNRQADAETRPDNIEPEISVPIALNSSESVYGQSSYTGLLNIGNSCFMNSIIQCLSNLVLLRDFFLQGHYLNDLNVENPLGFNGLLARQFDIVIRRLWSGNRNSFSPRMLMSVIAKRSPHFGNYQQQDSHEFMSFLLDGLHEDLNRVKEKPVTSPVECDGHSKADDAMMADKAWEVYRKRNNSFFVDYFQGQFKSTLVCPVCQNVSVTFDPFMSLSVPLPRDLRRLPIFFVPCDPDVIPKKYILELPRDANLELLKASVARKTNISMLQLRIFEAYDGKFQVLLSNNQQPIKSIREHDIIIVSEVLSGHSGHTSSAADAVVEINVIQRLKIPLYPSRCSFCSHAERKLLRCSKCKAVGYCNKDCQARDWSEHRMKCREGRPVPVGLPFVVSLPSSEFTYQRLSAVAKKFAMRSVKVDVTKDSADIQYENTVGVVDDPMYYFIPVNRYGDNKSMTKPLENRGDEVLRFDGKYLAMDWQNDPKDAHSIEVSPNDVIDHELDPLAATASEEYKGKSEVTLNRCIELLTQPETLSKEEAWYCPNCKEHREATKQISLWRLPHVLIIHLKRFSFSGLHRKDKINFNVHFPLEGLDMSQFMLGEAARRTEANVPPIYDLYSTVNHYGAIYMGHYTAQARGIPTDNKREWLVYDDEYVSTCHERRVVDQTAYILFYQLRQRKPL